MTWSSEDDVHVVWTFWVFFFLKYSGVLHRSVLNWTGRPPKGLRMGGPDDWTWACPSARLAISRAPPHEWSMLPSVRQVIVGLWTDIKAQAKAVNISQELMEEELCCAAD